MIGTVEVNTTRAFTVITVKPNDISWGPSLYFFYDKFNSEFLPTCNNEYVHFFNIFLLKVC